MSGEWVSVAATIRVNGRPLTFFLGQRARAVEDLPSAELAATLCVPDAAPVGLLAEPVRGPAMTSLPPDISAKLHAWAQRYYCLPANEVEASVDEEGNARVLLTQTAVAYVPRITVTCVFVKEPPR